MLALPTVAAQSTLLTSGRPVSSLLMAILVVIVSPFTFKSKEPLSLLLRERNHCCSRNVTKWILTVLCKEEIFFFFFSFTLFGDTWPSSFHADWWRRYQWTVWHRFQAPDPMQTWAIPHSLFVYWKKQHARLVKALGEKYHLNYPSFCWINGWLTLTGCTGPCQSETLSLSLKYLGLWWFGVSSGLKPSPVVCLAKGKFDGLMIGRCFSTYRRKWCCSAYHIQGLSLLAWPQPQGWWLRS